MAQTIKPDLAPQDGGCACASVRYRMLRNPLFVHCCHCRWCQRETGSAFALNGLIEAWEVALLAGEVDRPGRTGRSLGVHQLPPPGQGLYGASAHPAAPGGVAGADRQLDIESGVGWERQLTRKLASANAAILVVSPAFLAITLCDGDRDSGFRAATGDW